MTGWRRRVASSNHAIQTTGPRSARNTECSCLLRKSKGPGARLGRERGECSKESFPLVHACLDNGHVKDNMLLQAEVCEHGCCNTFIHLAVVFARENILVRLYLLLKPLCHSYIFCLLWRITKRRHTHIYPTSNFHKIRLHMLLMLIYFVGRAITTLFFFKYLSLESNSYSL